MYHTCTWGNGDGRQKAKQQGVRWKQIQQAVVSRSILPRAKVSAWDSGPYSDPSLNDTESFRTWWNLDVIETQALFKEPHECYRASWPKLPDIAPESR